MTIETDGIVQNNWAKIMNPLHSVLGIGAGFMRKAAVSLELNPGDSVLDVGCGTGTFLIELAKKYPHRKDHENSIQLFGLDPAENLLAKASTDSLKNGCEIHFKHGVMEHIPFPSDHFSVVTCTFTLHHLPLELKQTGLVEILRVLRPQGHVFIIDIGEPKNIYERFVSRLNSGVEHFSSNIHGEIPMLLRKVGFEEVAIVRHKTSFFLGGIDFIVGNKQPSP